MAGAGGVAGPAAPRPCRLLLTSLAPAATLALRHLTCRHD